MSPSDSAFTGVWIFHFLGQSFLPQWNLVKLKNLHSVFTLLTTSSSSWKSIDLIMFFCCCWFCYRHRKQHISDTSYNSFGSHSNSTVDSWHNEEPKEYFSCLPVSIPCVSLTDKEELTLTPAAVLEMRKAKGVWEFIWQVHREMSLWAHLLSALLTSTVKCQYANNQKSVSIMSSMLRHAMLG